ncbi:uncharacterized protein [Watersipora subatra]|uniref:uncharacterized protein n=1 Tax=Watersipora subatra TaxID=2589382 RepID=UPI00355ADB6D
MHGALDPKSDTTKWYLDREDGVNENDPAKILWDFYIRTEKHVLANQSDIVVVDKENKGATTIEVAVLNDYAIASKDKEKVEKYLPLGEEIEKCWDVRITVIPVFIGAQGAITPAHKMWLAQIPTAINSSELQKSALFGTAKILRPVLKLRGLW